ncbi:putative ribonuclease H-like domain-containing protein, partial [Tanacetum coccineum]
DEPMFGLMRTTSWSESKNHFFGQLTSTTLNLVEFVSHFDTAMDIQRYTYQTNQHKTRYATPDLLTDYVLIKEAREIYTRVLKGYSSFQRGMCRDVGQEMQLHEKNELDLMEETSLVMEIYVVKDKTGSVEYCIDKLASNIEELAIYSDSLQDLKSKVDTDLPNQRPMFDREVISSAFGVSKSSKVKIYNPLRSRNKGERSNKRIIPSKERAMTDGAKKGRKCNNCGDEDADHDSRNCPKPKKTLQQKSNAWYVVPTSRVKVPAGRYVVPTGKDNVIVSTGRSNVIPAGRTILVLKEEYETWAMKMEYWIMNSDHNLWNIVLNGNSRKKTGRDPKGNIMILPPVSVEEHIAVQRETKARTILLQSLPEDHMADFHHLDDARDIWLAVKARFGGNDESKKMRKSMLKQEFSEFRVSKSEGLHKGYDRFQKILSQLNQMQAKPDNEDCNKKFLRALPPSWSQVAITLKTKGGTSAPTHSAFISAASTNSKMSYPDQSYSTTFTSTSSSPTASSNVIENVLHSFVAESNPQQQITYEDFDQIGKLDLEELDIKWQMAMLSVRINRFEKKAGRKMKFNNKDAARFDKKKVKCYKCSELGHFARECTGKQLDSKARYSSFKLKELDKTEEPKALLSVDSMLNWSDHEGEDVESGAAQVYGMIAGAEEDAADSATDDVAGDVADGVSNAAAEFALMGISSQVQTCPFGCEHLYAELKKEFDNVEVQYKECYIQVQAYKSTLQTLEQQKGWYQSNQLALEEKVRILTANLENTTNMLKYTEKLNEQAKLEKLDYKAKLEESKARFDKWKDSSKNLDKLIHSSMSSRSKFGLGFGETFGSDEVFDPSAPSIFDTTPEDVAEKPLYDRFVKAVGMHAVPPPITGTFMPPSNNPDLDDTQVTYGSKSNNYFETNSVSNDFVSCDNSDKSSDSETTGFASFAFQTMSETAVQQPSSTNDDSSFSFKENVKPPRNLCNKSGVNSRSLCKRKSFGSKTCFVCGSKFHLIKDCDFYEKQLELHNKPLWNNVTHIPSFVPKAASVPAGSRNRPTSVPAGSRNRPTSVPTGRPFSAGWKNNAARPMTRPTSHYFQHFSRPGYYNLNTLVGLAIITKCIWMREDGELLSMTGNKEKLDDFVKIVGGTVTFGGGDGKITGKGTIRTSKLNFENVYYVEELQNFNLIPEGTILTISVSLNPPERVSQFAGKSILRKRLYSFQTNQPAGTKVNEASDMVESSSDYAEELARLQKQAYEANATAEKHLSQADLATSRNRVPAGKVDSAAGVTDGPTDPSTPVFQLLFAHHISGHSLGSSEHSTRYPSPSDLANSMSSYSEMEDIHHHPDSGIFSSSSYDDDFGGTVTNLAPSVVVDSVPTKRVNTIHPQSQILGDLTSPVQTRGTLKKSKFGASAFVSYVHDQQRNNHIDYLHCLFACFLSQLEPSSVAQALNDPAWIEAMQEEMQQFVNQEVWQLVPLPDGKIAIGTKWILKNKRDARGIVVRNKARLVAQGHRQEEGIDYDECFPLWKIEEEVYVTQPKGFEDPHFPKHVYRVVKASVMVSSAQGPVQVYVDDIIFGSTNKAWCDDFEVLMKGEFEMSAMGELTFFLGLQVKQKPDGIFISQDKYVQDILKKFDMESVRPATTPFEASKPNPGWNRNDAVKVYLYRSMLGEDLSLKGSTNTQPHFFVHHHMGAIKYRDEHNKVGFLEKPKGSDDYYQVLDFLRGSHIRASKEGPPAILATIDRTPYTIIESLVRTSLLMMVVLRLAIADIYCRVPLLATHCQFFSRPLESILTYSLPKCGSETMGGFFLSPPRSAQSPPEGTTSGGAEDLDKLTALSSLVSTLVHKVNTQESELKAHKLLFKERIRKDVKKLAKAAATAAAASAVPTGKSPLMEEDPPVRERTFRQREEDRLGERSVGKFMKKGRLNWEREREELQRKDNREEILCTKVSGKLNKPMDFAQHEGLYENFCDESKALPFILPDGPKHLVDDDTPVNFFAVVDWELLSTGLGLINVFYRKDNSRKCFTNKAAAGVGLVLCGDLKVLIDSPEVNDGSDVWKNQNTWSIQSWKLDLYFGVMCWRSGGLLVVHMFVDKKLPKTGWFSLAMYLGIKVASSKRVLSCPCLDADFLVADSKFMTVAFGDGFKMLLFNPLVISTKDLSRNLKLTMSNSSLGEDC